jgi:sigma-B regulation protein RsbU (phosphoserine phosphatase)
MKFRWKLMLVMLAVSILPIIVLRTFGIHNVQAMADALANEVQANRMRAAETNIQAVLKGFDEAMNLERERMGMALAFLSGFTRSAGGPRENSHPQAEAGFPARTGGPAPLSPFCVLAPASSSADDHRDIGRIAPVENMFSAVAEQLGDLILRQHVGLMSGVAAEYPCRESGKHLSDATSEAWFQNAFRDSVHGWSHPYHEESSGRWATGISRLLEDDDDRPIGVVSLEVDLDRLMERTLAFIDLPTGAKALFCMLEKRPDAAVPGLRILLEYPATGEATSGYLKIADVGQELDMADDIARRVSRIVRMPHAGQDAYWAYVSLPIQGVALVTIFPVADLLQPALPVQAAIEQRLRQVEILTGGFLAVLAAVNAVVVFVLSRMVTRPLEALSAASQRLASGDFETRVRIARRDEFGAMGEVFNRVVPQLKQHYRDREALQAAVEIQQSLLPRSAPRIPGLDIHAMSLYSEQVGGDYYDYLCIGEGGPQRLCVAVGDVSGHGIPSAITMATVRAFLRLRAAMPGTLGDIIADVNRKLGEDVEYSGQFMTLFLLRIDRGARRMQWIRAGQDPGLLYDGRRDTFREMTGEGAPLGVSDQTRFVESATSLEPDQIIVIGTDGIWEARNAAGEMFGKARLMDLIRRHAKGEAQALVLAVLDAVEEFRDPNGLADDMTLMVIKVNE